jgi:Fic family protein
MTGKVLHEGPPADEVPDRMVSMFDWLQRKLDAESGEPPFVLAGVMHYGITDVHPFADGNGSVARLFQAAVLTHQGALPGCMFSFERYYAENRPAYYAALRSVRERTYNMEFWLEYFVRGLVEEYERVASTVADLSQSVAGGDHAPLRLTGTQQNGLTKLRLEARREFTRRDYEQVTGVSRAVAGRELAALVSHGTLTTRGSGPKTSYRFAGSTAAVVPTSVGRPAKWTDATIERELRSWLGDRETWPTAQEFTAAGKRSLYAAASRNGGIVRWRSHFQLGPTGRPRAST